MQIKRYLQWVSQAVLLVTLNTVIADDKTNVTFELSDRCPPSFEQLDNGVCKLVTLYDRYDSLQNKGVGGLKTSLAERRDGFTAKQIDLGRYLFFDPLLSGDRSISCASCHHPDLGFSDGLARSIGVLGSEIKRAAPTLWNSAFLTSFFWDARSKTLEDQLLGPLFSADEMGNTPQGLLAAINGNEIYRRLFNDAFAQSTQSITLQNIYTAISAFEASLVSFNSRYDQYAHGYADALNEREIAGLNIFRSFVARCSECHTPPLFTNQQIAVIGTPVVEGMALDVGAEKTYNAPELKGGFKVPTLRNIEKTAPYMHAGQFSTLRDAIEFYTKGRGHAVPDDVQLQLHWHIWEPDLQPHELDLLVDFLKTLTDEAFTPQIPNAVPSGLTPITHRNQSQQKQQSLTNAVISNNQ